MSEAKTALVVEGGAMRGMFSAGVLDVFLEQRFDPFESVIGTSAGACNLASHVAGQHGRNVRCYSSLMTRPEFIDLRRLLGSKHVLDLDWLWDELARIEPLDVAAILASGKEFIAVATCKSSGEPVYLRPTAETFFDVLKASCALPFFYRRELRVHGHDVVDGGLSDPFAAAESYRLGARRIMVIRSRPATFTKKPSWMSALASFAVPSPGLARAHRNAAERYRRAVQFVLEPPRDCHIVHVAPEVPLPVSRMTQDAQALERTYALGREHGLRAIETWQALPSS